ncbi:MAG: hypothetical protein OXG84_03265 [Chloroflexi bacterium]|nr:hypothetical protein [Chloroflexota bacterium]
MTKALLFFVCASVMFALVPLAAAQPPPADLQLKCDADGLFFQWRAVKKAQHYRYRLVADGERLINSRTKKTSIHLGTGDPGQEYTARVRVKRNGKLSKWSSVKTQCPAAAPILDPSATFTINDIGRHPKYCDYANICDYASVEWSWKHLPASTAFVVILMRPAEDYYHSCGRVFSRTYRLPSEGKDAKVYYSLCPDTSYYWAFALQDTSGRIKFLEEARFRTLPS